MGVCEELWSEDLLVRYATGAAPAVVVWSVEAHLAGCPRCRSALSAYVDAGRLARNRSAVLVRVALPRAGRVRRLLCRCGIPDYLLDLLAATPSLRRSWLLSVVGVLAVLTGAAAAVRYGSMPRGGHAGLAGNPNPVVLAPFLLVAPLVVLAGVAAAFLPMFDPAHRLAVAAPLAARRVAAAVAGAVRIRARGGDRDGPPCCRGHRGGVVGAAGAAARGDSRSARHRAAECPVRLCRRAYHLGGGAVSAP